MTPLEHRYRMLLRVLPAWYRDDRDEEMVATFLAARHAGDDTDDLDQEYGWPGWAEAFATAALAVRTRLAATGAPPRALAAGGIVRTAALLGLLIQSAFAAATLTGALVTAARQQPGTVVTPLPVGQVLPLLAVLPLVSLLRGHRGWARIWGLCAVAPTVITLAAKVIQPPGTVWPAVVVDLPLWVAVACLFAGFHRAAPAPRPTPWLRALVAAVALSVLWQAVVSLVAPVPWTWVTIDDPAALPSWGVVLAGVAYLALAAVRPGVAGGSWPGAVAVTGVMMVPHQATVAWFAGTLHAQGVLGPGPVAVAYGQLAALALIILGTGVLAVRAVRLAGGQWPAGAKNR